MKNILIILFGLVIDLAGAQGNVGIGTPTPTAKLDIIGNLKITDGTQGIGKVLTSDAVGKATWQTPSTPPPPADPTNDWPTVQIGCATWMTKNLDVTTYRNGDTIPLLNKSADWIADTIGAYCYYQNNSANGPVYGKLYNWYAVNNPKGLAPEGWHIPSDFEWTTLIKTLGGADEAGGMMKAIGTAHWITPNLGATNLSNFSAQPGGYRGVQGGFNVQGDFGYWWTATAADSNIAWSRNLNNKDTYIGATGSAKVIGYSVRCVKD